MLQDNFKAVHSVRIVAARSKTKKADKQSLLLTLKTHAKSLANEGAETLLLPVKFGNQHWCVTADDLKNKRVLHYDSMNATRLKSALDDLAWDLTGCLGDDFTVTSLNAPTQFDGYSCGAFACEVLAACGRRYIARFVN